MVQGGLGVGMEIGTRELVAKEGVSRNVGFDGLVGV